jgi:hypothetical protein
MIMAGLNDGLVKSIIAHYISCKINISEVDIRNALYSPIGPLVGVKTNWDYRQLMGLKGPAFVNVFA